MATAARKARKRAGIKFEKATPEHAKVGTPIHERAWFNAEFPGARGTRHFGTYMRRSATKRGNALLARGLDPADYGLEQVG